MAKDYIYVKEPIWGKLGKHIETSKISNSQDLIEQGDLNWEVAATKMYTELHPSVFGYNAIYRKDDNRILGVVNSMYPKLVQNRDTFNVVNSMLHRSVEVESVGSIQNDKSVFACFKILDDYKLFDDDIDQYFLIVNDHLKVDGKVAVYYTPIRVSCWNCLSYAISSSYYKVRIPVYGAISEDSMFNGDILDKARKSLDLLNNKARRYYNLKITRDNVENLLDILFPVIEDEFGTHERSNEQSEISREYFLHCMDEDNLGNFRNTGYQMFQALMDFSQHYFMNPDKAYDLTYRMSLLPNLGDGANLQADIAKKGMKYLNQLVKKAA